MEHSTSSHGAAFLAHLRAALRMYAIRQAADGNQEYASRQAVDGNQGARAYILRGFLADAKQRSALDPVRVLADLLEPNIEKLLGTQAKPGRPRKYAILVHAMVRYWMLQRSLRPELTQGRGDSQAAAADALGMTLNTVQKNYKDVQRLIKTIKANPFYLERSGFAPDEELYLRYPKTEFFVLNVVKQLLLDEEYCLRDPENALNIMERFLLKKNLYLNPEKELFLSGNSKFLL